MTDETTYYELTNKQQQLVDAVAQLRLDGRTKNTDRGIIQTEDVYTFEDARNLMDDPYAAGSWNQWQQVHDDWFHIVEERMQMLANYRSEPENGQVQTTGEPKLQDHANPDQETIDIKTNNARYTGPETGIDATIQYLSERPIKTVQPASESNGVLVTIEIERENAFELVRELEEEHARAVYEAVIES